MALTHKSSLETATLKSSPHMVAPLDTAGLMKLALLATIPGVIALTYHFGWGTVINIVIACITAIAGEAAILALRKRPISFYLKDYSAAVTAVLLGIALPPLAPWWLVITGTLFAIIIAKHLYGGLGFNPFNPAMVGYVVLLISFPVEMTSWQLPAVILTEGIQHPGLVDSIALIFGAERSILDATTGATPLDLLKHNTGYLIEQFYASQPIFNAGSLAGAGWEWANLGFLAGGIYLLWRKVFTWHAPVGMLATLLILAWLFNEDGSSTGKGGALFHLLSGATMLGAFFIVTDPVTSATSTKGRLIYGALIGLLLFVIRSWGNYPDAIAFAVLLANFAAPLIDYYTPPRTYGHTNVRKTIDKGEP